MVTFFWRQSPDSGATMGGINNYIGRHRDTHNSSNSDDSSRLGGGAMSSKLNHFVSADACGPPAVPAIVLLWNIWNDDFFSSPFLPLLLHLVCKCWTNQLLDEETATGRK